MNTVAIALLAVLFLAMETPAQKASVNVSGKTAICNPLNLSYRVCLDASYRWKAVDPTMVVYKGECYFFAFKSGGYFHTTDLINWQLITINDF